ncbi:RsiV family protein [Hyphomonas sp.]|uniref:RsiV family protein n=1 Tax=Hyphomonas sp. TaxID=87 RepID=UPI00391A153D
MQRLVATAAFAALILAACSPPAPAGTDSAALDPAAEAASAPADTPPEGFELSHVVESENFRGSSEIDPAILAFDPPLAYRLWTKAKAELDDLGNSANEGRRMADEDAAATGEASWFRGYTLDISHKATSLLDDVISVSDAVGTDTGGAHPNYFIAGGVYRKGEPLALGLDTFIADPAAFNEQVIQALVVVKLERGFEAAARDAVEAELRDLLTPSSENLELYKGKFVLAPSTETGRAGGITVLFSPYDVGSYAEGSYEVTLSAADLAPILTEAWRARFGGEPVTADQ